MFPLGPVIYFRSQACFTPSEPARPLADAAAAVPVAVMKCTIFERSHSPVQPRPVPPRPAPRR